jgi:hypothetical protein
MRCFRPLAAGALAALATATPAAAATVLGFEHINAAYPTTTYAQILAFYDGGTSSQGTTGNSYGQNFGITFAANAVAVCLNKAGGSCSNASRGLAGTNSKQGAFGIDSGGSTYLDFATPYSGFIAFSYQVAPGFAASIQAFGGAGGTGAALTGPLPLFNTAPGCPAYNAPICHLGPGGLGFVAGASSIVFSGAPGRFVFDDLTFGAGNDPLSPPAVLPEPGTWAVVLLGFGLLGAALRRRYRQPRRA